MAPNQYRGFGWEPIRVEGLKEFRYELKAVDKNLPRTIRVASNSAAKIIVDAAKANANALGGVARKTAPSIKAASTQTAARVSIGGPSFPFAMGAEFGGQKRPTTQQFKPWRGNQFHEGIEPGSQVGYFLHPAIREKQVEFRDTLDEAIADLFRKIFPD